MITLFGFGPFMGTPDASPFVTKTMVLLSMSDVEFRTVVGNPFASQTKFLPYVVDGRETVSDSTRIRRHLERKYDVDFDRSLSPGQKALSWTIERMCEDHLYFAMLESRWLNRQHFRKGLGKSAFKSIPLPLRPFVKSYLIGLNRKRLFGHGLGRLDRATIADMAARDIDALAILLGEKPFVMGEAVCGADATLFGLVAAILVPPLDSPVREAMKSHANLVGYNARMMRRFFPQFATSGN